MTKSEIKSLYEINCDKRHEMRQTIVEKMRDDALNRLIAKGCTKEQIDEIFDSKIPDSKLGIKASAINKALWANKEFKKLIKEERYLSSLGTKYKATGNYQGLKGKKKKINNGTCIIKGCGRKIDSVMRCTYHYHRYYISKRFNKRIAIYGRKEKK